MCLLAFLVEQNPYFPFIVVGNRDEFHQRPTAPAHWWAPHDQPGSVWAGKDLQAGGTWMGISNHGRFAALTNIRNPALQKNESNTPSRGHLVRQYLHNEGSPQHVDQYEGFNLLTANIQTQSIDVSYFHNHPSCPIGSGTRLPSGAYTLSNGYLNEGWPKETALMASLQGLRSAQSVSDQIIPMAMKALSNDATVADEYLPHTGVPLEWERMLSAIKIQGPGYGSRSSSVLAIDQHGEVFCFEASLTPDGNIGQRVQAQFKIMPRCNL